MKKYKVEVHYEVGGFIKVYASDEESAKALVRRSMEDMGINEDTLDCVHRDYHVFNCLECPKIDGGMVVGLEKHGVYFTVEDGELLSAPMLKNGSVESNEGSINWSNVSAPEDQAILDDINVLFGTDFKFVKL